MCSIRPAERTSFRCRLRVSSSPRARTPYAACVCPTRSYDGTRIVAEPRLPTPPRTRASRSRLSFIRSWTTKPMAVLELRCSDRRSAVSLNAQPSGRFRRTHRLRRRWGSSLVALQRCLAGGCAGSLGRLRSSTLGRRLRAPCRACSHRASAPRRPESFRRSESAPRAIALRESDFAAARETRTSSPRAGTVAPADSCSSPVPVALACTMTRLRD